MRLAFLFPLLCLGFLRAQELTPLEKRGQHIYLTGTTGKGEAIPTYLGESTNTIPSYLFACVNCHGPDGRGIPEGGVKPSNITWHDLTKPYGAISETHRDRPPYNEEQVLTAIRKGIDPLEGRLEPSMPRFHLNKNDGAAIVAYLKIIHRVLDPGVEKNQIKIGIVFPSREPFQTIQKMLTIYFDQINQEGGVYRRHIKLAPLNLSEDSTKWLSEWTSFLEKKSPFLLLTPFMDDHDTEPLVELITSQRIPVISPIIAAPHQAALPNPYLFYFYPGPATLSETLLQHAREKLFPDEASCILGSATAPKISKLLETNTRSILVTPQELPETLRLLQSASWKPALLLTTPAESSILKTYSGDIYLASPHPSDHPEALQKSALIAAETLRTLLLKAGRKVTRRKLIGLLESFHQHETEWTGPLTFNRNRRLGPRGAFIRKYDTSLNNSQSWIPLHE
jgi:hypothetical protein